MDGTNPPTEDKEPEEEDLVEVEEEEEEEETKPTNDDSEELEMWMRQTRRASLLTPEQEVHLAMLVQATEFALKGKNAELIKLLRRGEMARFGHP